MLTDEQLRKIMKLLLEEMLIGLSDESKATVKMLPSFVRAVPNGTGAFFCVCYNHLLPINGRFWFLFKNLEIFLHLIWAERIFEFF